MPWRREKLLFRDVHKGNDDPYADIPSWIEETFPSRSFIESCIAETGKMILIGPVEKILGEDAYGRPLLSLYHDIRSG